MDLTTETNTDTGQDSEETPGKADTLILTEELKVIEGHSEQLLGDLLSVRGSYDRFRAAVQITFKYTIVILQTQLPGRASNARFHWDEWSQNATIYVSMFYNHNPEWVMSRVIHELAEFNLVKTLKAVEAFTSKAEAKKIIRDVMKDYYPDMTPLKNF